MLRCKDLWDRCYVTCFYAADGVGVGWGGVGHVNVPCTLYIIVRYAAEICGILATLLVTTLQRSLVLLLRDMILRCWWGGVGWGGHVNVPCTSYIIVCYAAKICGIVATLVVTTLLLRC